jgi:hypothetical protein
MPHNPGRAGRGNLTSSFIDLATFDELEKYLYGGSKAITYFVRKTRKSSWFSQVPVALSQCSGNADFGANEFSVNISRAGDYMLHNWLRVTVPEIKGALRPPRTNVNIRWTRNLMHNLVEECSIVFNDLVMARFDSYHLDFWSAFTVPAGKRVGYDNMIGNVPPLINPNPGNDLPETVLNLPLPFPHTRDSGVALPTAALPYNEMKILFQFRNWNELLIVDDGDDGDPLVPRCAELADIKGGQVPHLKDVQVWANYAVVSNAERVKMGAAPRDICIEQVQSAPRRTINNEVLDNDIRFSHAVKALFFAARNRTVECEWSNYTTESSYRVGDDVNFAPGVDPIIETSLLYENTIRLGEMGSDYFYQCRTFSVPEETGYHMYSYALDMLCLDPTGSTNFGKLTNITLSHHFSDETSGKLLDTIDGYQTDVSKNFQLICTAVNNNVVRISGGALGFPVL